MQRTAKKTFSQCTLAAHLQVAQANDNAGQTQ